MLNNWRKTTQDTIQFKDWGMFITSSQDDFGKLYGFIIKEKEKDICRTAARWDNITEAKEMCEARLFQYLKDQIKHYQSCLHSFEEDTNA